MGCRWDIPSVKALLKPRQHQKCCRSQVGRGEKEPVWYWSCLSWKLNVFKCWKNQERYKTIAASGFSRVLDDSRHHVCWFMSTVNRSLDLLHKYVLTHKLSECSFTNFFAPAHSDRWHLYSLSGLWEPFLLPCHLTLLLVESLCMTGDNGAKCFL